MSNIFINLLNMSITTSWLIVAVFILRLAFRKAPRYIICAAWLLVGLRLIIPVSFETALSLIPSTEVFDADMVDSSNKFSVYTGIDAVDESVNDYMSKYYEGATVDLGLKRDIVSAATVVWLAGMLALLSHAVISYIRLKRKVKTATILRDNIRQSENVESPFVLGALRPTIYMPYKIDMADMEYIIAHETAHIKRGDHIVKLIGFVLLSVYWFNPLIWAAYVMFCKDVELACDEKVIKSLDEDLRKAYSEALLNCAIKKRSHIIAACPVAFGEVGVKERIKSIMNYKKPGFYIVIVAVAALVVVVVCFMTDPVAVEQEDNTGYYGELVFSEYDDKVYRFNKKYVLDVKDKNGLNSVTNVVGLPGIVFDTENKKFHFFYDALSSYLSYGSYVIEDGLLIATTDDGLYIYKFKIDGDNLVFVREGSSSVRVTDSEFLGYSIEDGSVFEPDMPFSPISDLYN